MTTCNENLTYRELLKRAPKEYCQLVAKTIGLSRQLSLQSLREQISEKVLNSTWLQNFINHLNDDHRAVLTSLTFLCGSHGMPLDLFNQKLKHYGRHAATQTRQVLNESGLIFAVGADNFQYTYIIPEDLRFLLLQIFSEDMNDALFSPTSEPKTIRSDGLALIQDIFTFLSFAARNGVQLTRQHTVHKHVQKRLLNAFEVSADTIKIYNQINPTEGNADRLKFIQRFCRHHQLINFADSKMQCSSLGHEWTQKSDAEKLSNIYSYWVEHDVTASRSLTIVLSILRILSPKRWVLLSSIQEKVRQLSVEEIWEQTLYSNLERTFANHLTYMGCLNFSKLDNDIAIQVTDTGRRLLTGEPLENYEWESSFIAQPNYEILASTYLSPTIRWTLNKIAEIRRASQVITYKLTPQSIYDGLRCGFSVDEILKFLKTYSRTSLPQNIDLSIREWGNRYGQIYFMDLTLLRCKSEGLAQELKSSKQIAEHILGEISSTDLIIPRGKISELRQLLERQNFMPLANTVTLEKE